MTPWQLDVALKMYVDERKQQQKMLTWHAWHTAMLQRIKKMPKLSDLMDGGESKQDMAKRLKATLKAAFPNKKVNNGD